MARAGDCMFAEPVPVRRPGVCLMEVDEVACVGIASGTGKTKIGLNLETDRQLVERCEGVITNVIESQTTSIHEAQFETMISPGPGFHDSLFPVPLLSVKLAMSTTDCHVADPFFLDTCSTEIENIPRINKAERPRI